MPQIPVHKTRFIDKINIFDQYMKSEPYYFVIYQNLPNDESGEISFIFSQTKQTK
jgi:hypothetical protein